MEFSELLGIVGDLPTFETGLLLVGNIDPINVRKQLSRWTAAGKVYQLRRGLYTLAPPYQKTRPHPFVIANQYQTGSYVSLQSALAFHAMIPEHVPVITSVTTGRPGAYSTPLGEFVYRHIQVEWFAGYQRVKLDNQQVAFVATPEKALLDLVYLTPGGDDERFLRSMRLQALDQIKLPQLHQLSSLTGAPRLLRAIHVIERLMNEEHTGYDPL